MNITDVIIDGYWKVESVGKNRIIAKTCCGNSRGKRVYLNTYKTLHNIAIMGIACHEAIQRARSTGQPYFDCGQDVTKWFAQQLVAKRYGSKQSNVPSYLWNVINPMVEEWV
jgi:hypothetical protein